MNILITGGSGFIGSNLAKYHLEKKDHVWVIDSLITGKKENIEPFLSSSFFTFTKADICSYEEMEKAVLWADRIYHMAAILGQKYVIKHPVEVIEVNIKTTERVLQLASRSAKKPQVLIASSSGVYGERKGKDFIEDSVLHIEPQYFLQENYSLGKIANEMMALSYIHETGLPCVITRIFNAIGSNQTDRYGMVVPSLIKQALQGKDLTVYGDGKQTRSFCHVQDIIEGMDTLLNTKSCHGQIINIGSDREISILDLAKLIIDRTKSSSKISFIPYQEAYGMDFCDVRNRRPVLDKIRSLTGFTPRLSLEESVDQIAASFSF